ncbi:MAG: sigma-54 interaction domain-containing protein [Candidatus Avilachnospira sp.]
MKKKLILFTVDTVVKNDNLKDLRDVFGDVIDIEAYSLDQEIPPGEIEGDLVLTVSTFDMERILPYLKGNAEIFHGNRTILYESYERLKLLPEGTRALVVTTNIMACMELTALLIRSGINHVKFLPLYEGMGSMPEADIVVIPQELKGIPDTGNLPKFNLGRRRITDETYRAIAFSLGVRTAEIEERIEKKTANLLKLRTFDIPLARICSLEDMLNDTFDEIDDGVVIANRNGRIIYVNRSFLKITGLRKKYTGNAELEDIIPERLKKELSNAEEKENIIFEIPEIGKTCLISRKNIVSGNAETRYVAIFKDITNIEKLETKIRSTLHRQTYKAKYTFSDILGESPAIMDTIKKAKRIAKFEKTTIIYGESGTGKEMIAQAMHNISARRKMPFVGINCAALSPELIESELFGYEEGTFTGAKKGGKRGLFELAHNGTLFLDEIGTIPPEVQMKLLRVLQEYEVRRIGGEDIIPVNVWVIAATNSDLKRLVEEGKFRADLYYRLNIFPVKVPPLRERGEDSGLIFKNMVRDYNKSEMKNKKISEGLMKAVKKYSWPGNIRQLKNAAEYLWYMSDEVLEASDLSYILDTSPDAPSDQDSENCNRDRNYHRTDAKNDRLSESGSSNEQKLLSIIKELQREGISGRRKLKSKLEERDIKVSEYKLRKLLKLTEEEKTHA